MITELVLGFIGYKFVKHHIDKAKEKPREDDGIASDPSLVERYKELYDIDPATGPEVEGEPVD